VQNYSCIIGISIGVEIFIKNLFERWKFYLKKKLLYLSLLFCISILAGCNTKREAINTNQELIAGTQEQLEFNVNKKDIDYNDLSFISSD